MNYPIWLQILILAPCAWVTWSAADALRSNPPGTAPGHPIVSVTGWVCGAYWLWGACWRVNAPHGWPGAVIWAFGCWLAFLHMAAAFHLAHGYAHAAAYEHTARVGGFGAGIFVNYLFLAVWAADAAWMWAASHSYRRRSRRLTWAVHGFLAFVVFNATVVFGSWPTRVGGGLLFVGLIVMLIRRPTAKR